MKNKSLKLVMGISLNAIAIILVIFLVYSVGNKAFAFGAKVFHEQSVDTESTARDVEVSITDHVTTKQLANVLYTKGLINDKTVFYCQVELSDYKNKFIAGTYKLNTSMTPTKIMETLCATATESSAE